MSDKVKIALIEPCSDAPYDTLIVECETDTWAEIMAAVENELDAQFAYLEDNNQTWGDIEVKVKCREVTRDWIDEHTEQ